MVRVRKLVLAIAAASALSSGMAHALGLGEVTLKSALNQPLDAEIQLLEVRDLATNEVIPSLATADDFAKAGVDRQFFLNDLTFTPIFRPNGKSVIHVTSKKPVREPYLNFLVQVMWPSGRLLREYTLLLDPPVYTPQAVAAIAPQLPIAAPVQRTQAQAPRPAPAPAAPVAPRPAPSAQPGNGQYTTTSRDNLWDIAARHRSGGSVQQEMLAIQELNPDAFIDGNINRLKSGQVLRLPDPQQVSSRTQPEAVKEVNAQTTAWRQGRGRDASDTARQLDATRRDEAGAAPTQTDAKDNLSLVSAESAKTGKGAKGDSKALSNKLAVTEESLDTTRRDNEELKSRMTDLQSQLDKLQRLIQLKNDQLAKLQAEGGAPAVPAAGTPAAASASASATAAPATPTAAGTPVAGATATPAPAIPATAAPANTTATLAPAPGVPPVAPAPAPAVVKPAVAPAPAPQPAGTFDDLLDNPMMLGLVGGGALLILLLLLLLLARRRRAQRDAELQLLAARAEDDEPRFASSLGMDEDLDGLEVTPQAVEVPLAPDSTVPNDPLGEADIYIAYGRFNQAAELLQNAIRHEPQRADLRLKLMEVHAELNDHAGFVAQERGLDAIGGSQTEIDHLKSRYPSMALVAAGGLAAAAVADDLDSFGLHDPAFDESDFKESDFEVPVTHSAQPEHKALDDDFDLSLDDLDELPAHAEPALESHTALAKPADDFDELSDLSLDDEFSLDAPVTTAATAEADELSFDALLERESLNADSSLADELADFDLQLPADKATGVSDEDFLLNFDEDLNGLPELQEGANEEAHLPSDFDLSLGDDDASAAAFSAELDDVDAELDRLAADSPAAVPAASLPVADEAEIEHPTFTAEDAAALEPEADFDFLSDTDEASTKLDLARAYIDMGDSDGARDILDEVISEGNDGQQSEARKLLSSLA